MTRINAGIPPAELSDKHLIAEHREIKRIPNHLAKHWPKLCKNKNLPLYFTLGKGHVLFFMDKGEYTYERYEQLYKECKKRGFNVIYYGHAWDIYNDLDTRWYKDWEPTPEAIELIRERIALNTAAALLKKQQKLKASSCWICGAKVIEKEGGSSSKRICGDCLMI